eukprot:COSAG01_NODE_69944_length_260_cov_0.565217_1_plen_44_part_10
MTPAVTQPGSQNVGCLVFSVSSGVGRVPYDAEVVPCTSLKTFRT